MRRFVSVGDRYGMWQVLEFSHKGNYGRLYWLCQCDCGTIKSTGGPGLLKGESTNCGCKGRNFQHGMTKTRTFKTWDSMLQRCFNKNSPDYKRYGEKGITVCERWLAFENFYEDMGERPEGTSLDRIDNNKGYSKENCKWSNRSEQQRNKSNSRWIDYKGEQKMLLDVSKEVGIPYDLLLRRVNRGLTGSALFAPSRSKKTSRFKG